MLYGCIVCPFVQETQNLVIETGLNDLLAVANECTCCRLSNLDYLGNAYIIINQQISARVKPIKQCTLSCNNISLFKEMHFHSGLGQHALELFSCFYELRYYGEVGTGIREMMGVVAVKLDASIIAV